jgi:16S rRNA (cytosine967-C5)-methyltransferase
VAKSAREIALNILVDVNEKGAYSNIAIYKYLQNSMDKRDENLVREIVYGVLENRLYIDYIIGKVSKIKLKKLSALILEILRIGVYQIVLWIEFLIVQQ